DENDSPDFQSAKQAAALTSGDITPFFRDVDFTKIAAGVTQAPTPPKTDQNFTRIYTTAGWPNALPEGVNRNGGVTRSFYNGRYEHVGELAVLEVMADVQRYYNIDRNRVCLGGTSMGGLGTVKIAESHPDLFAGIFPSVPPMSDRAQGYVLPQNNDWDLAALT